MLSFSRNRTHYVCVVMAAMLVAALSSVTTLASDENAEIIAYGERLVHNMDCNACHTPKIFAPQGPAAGCQQAALRTSI